jgi:hypothetical protein
MLSAYFRDVAHKKTMLELLHERDVIQAEARDTLRKRFLDFDMECVDVLIGKPDTAEAGGKIETLLEQLRIRQLSIEQLETFERQGKAADKQRALNDALALAQKQTELTASQVQIRIAENQGDADLARARKQAEQQVVMAQAELAKSRLHADQVVVTAQAESQQRVLAGKGESQRLLQIGLSEASVLMQKVASYGDPRLYALALVAEHLAHSEQPLVPQHMFVTGGSGNDGTNLGQGLLGTLVNLLVAEKSGFRYDPNGHGSAMKELAEKLTRQAMEAMQNAGNMDLPATTEIKPAAPAGNKRAPVV